MPRFAATGKTTILARASSRRRFFTQQQMMTMSKMRPTTLTTQPTMTPTFESESELGGGVAEPSDAQVAGM